MPSTIGRQALKNGVAHRPNGATNFHGYKTTGKTGQDFTQIAGKQAMEGTKVGRDSLGGYGGGFGWDSSPMRRNNSKSPARKAASAMIAKIPLPLSRYIGAVFYPGREASA